MGFGALGGIASSAPIGPINLWVARWATDGRAGRLAVLTGFLAGVLVIDLGFAAIAATGSAALLSGPWVLGRGMVLVGGVLLVIVGWHQLKSAGALGGAVDEQARPGATGPARCFALGVVICASNPGFLAFWLFFTGLMIEWGIAGFGSGVSLPFFLLGIAAGDLAWFRTLIWLMRRASGAISSKLLVRVRQALAVAMLLGGVLSISKGAFGP